MDYGGFWIRFLAYLVDSLIVVIAFVVINALLGLMGLELAGGQIVLLVLGILYYAFMQASPRQATLGKALVGLKVGGMEGERISFGRALAREVAKIMSALTFLIGFIIACFTKRKQALHDLIASTCVVRAEPGRVMAALALGVVALAAPFVAAAILGAEAVASAMGVTPPGPAIAMQAPPKPAPKPAAPAPKPAAAVAAPSPVVAAPAPAVVAPVPAEKPVVIPATTPVILAQATEAPKPAPVPAEPPKVEAPKPAPAAPPAPRADQVPPPAVPRVVPGPTIPTPKYNDLVTAVIYRDPKTVEQLLALGKWPDKPDSRGITALMTAALLGDKASAEALLKAGASPNRPGPGGDTATTIARDREDAAMVSLLQRYGGK
jgi:uncharacterized RDD family membrane protein YckC